MVLCIIRIRPLDGLFVLVWPRDRCNIPHRVVCVARAAAGPAGAEAGVGLAGNLRRRAGGGDVAIGVALGVESRHGLAGEALQIVVGKRCGAARAEVGSGHGAVAGVVGVAAGVGFGGRFAVFCLEQGPALLFDTVGVVVEGLRPLVEGPVCDLLGANDAAQGIIFVPVALLLVAYAKCYSYSSCSIH